MFALIAQTPAPSPTQHEIVDLTGRRAEGSVCEQKQVPGLGEISVAYTQGKDIANNPERLRLIEDCAWAFRGSDGKLILLVTDGVGEQYNGPSNRKLYQYKDSPPIVLGDIPGRILADTLKEAAQRAPHKLDTVAGAKIVLVAASIRYRDFLKGIDLYNKFDGAKEEIGGATFAFAVIQPGGEGYICSAGDAIGVVRHSDGAISGTSNQLPAVNAALEGIKPLLEKALKEAGSSEPTKDMRGIFNALFKKRQRNEFTNTSEAVFKRDQISASLESLLNKLDYLSPEKKGEIHAAVMNLVPEKVPGYAFFDGNHNIVNCISTTTLKQGDTVVLCTDGAFDSVQRDMTALHKGVVTDLERGVVGLRDRNQRREKGPESTVAVFTPA